MSRNVRVRFAPSPTGFLHVGGVRTALFNYLFAKNQGGKFILRLEDTDRERFIPEGIKQIQESLAWLGLEPDELHQQSQRHLEHGIYQKYADKLVAEGFAYYSPTSPDALERLREQSKKAKKPFMYRRTDDPKNTTEAVPNTPIRIDVLAVLQKIGIDTFKWSEPTGRELEWKADLVDDFILVKADGYPTYNFANVVDDHDMKISHVMRGDEFIASTPKHILLYKILGMNEPVFVHLPVINGTDGQKLSKRTGDTNVLDYQKKGYLADALLNFLALLGWNDGTEQEIFSMNELIKKFSLKRINTSPAVFDPKRLDWFSAEYIRKLSIDQLKSLVLPYWEGKNTSDEVLKRTLTIAQDRLTTLSDINSLTSWQSKYGTPKPESLKEITSLMKDEKIDVKQWLSSVIEIIESKGSEHRDKLEDSLRQAVNQSGSPRALFGSLRIALTQEDNTPPIWDIVYVLGKNESIKRLEAVRDKL